LCELAEVPYTVRLEHVAGAELQIDRIGMHVETGKVLATWGEVKNLYQ
jgi:hypothetical protein